MSCRHDLANGTCRRCYPTSGTIDPGPEDDYGPNLEGPGAVTLEQYRAIEEAWKKKALITSQYGKDSAPRGGPGEAPRLEEGTDERPSEVTTWDERKRRRKTSVLLRILELGRLAPARVVDGPYWTELVFFGDNCGWHNVAVRDSDPGNFLCTWRGDRACGAAIISDLGEVVSWVRSRLGEIASPSDDCICPHPVGSKAYVHDVSCPVDHRGEGKSGG